MGCLSAKGKIQTRNDKPKSFALANHFTPNLTKKLGISHEILLTQQRVAYMMSTSVVKDHGYQLESEYLLSSSEHLWEVVG